MKNKLTLLSLALFLNIGIFAQAPPQKINYQAVARDLSGNPMIGSPLTVIFDIRQGSGSGTVVYSETHTPTTNQFGLFTSAIGGGTPNSPFTLANFAGITWGSNMYFLQVTVNGNVMPSTQLLSVPYALHAGSATTGTPGANGLNCWDLNGNGAQDAAEDINGDGFWDALDCKGDTGLAGINGTNGIGINWLGTFTSNPASPNLNDAYYNSTDGKSYIWDGTVWQTLAQDGSTSSLTAGTGIDITTGVVSNTGDLDSTNELITSAILNGTTLEIIEDGVLHTVSLASLSGADNWGTDTVNTLGGNLLGSGTVTNPLIVIDNDTSATNELELPMTGNNVGDVLKWNGSAWINANDSVDDADNDPANEIELPPTAIFNQVLTWDGSAWVAQNPGSGADNWGTQYVIADGTTITGTGLVGDTLRGFDGQYSSLTGAPTNISSFTNDVPYLTSFTEVDGSTTNEIQTLSFSDPTLTLSNGGGTVSIPDTDPANEYNTSFTVNAGNLELTDGGNTFQVPLTSLGDNDWTSGAGTIYNTTDSIGIGTNAPEALLHVTRYNTPQFKIGNDNQPAYEWSFDVDPVANMTIRNEGNGTPMDFIYLNSSNNNIGIGTNNPTARFHHSGSLRLDNLSGTAPAVGSVLTSIDAQGNAEWQPPAMTTTYWSPSGSDIYNSNSGNVGIGPMHSTIGGPGYFLTSGKALTIATVNSYTTSPPAQLELVSSSATGTDIMGRVAFGHVVNAPTLPTYVGGIEMDKNGSMMFSTNGANERVRIDYNGNMGIGTTSPGHKLHVFQPAGAGEIVLESPVAGNLEYRLVNTNTDYAFELNGTNLNIKQAGTDLMTFSSGNVGVGTNPSYSVFDVNGQITMRTGATNGYIPVSDANGTMTWTDPSTISTASFWTQSAGRLYPSTLTDQVGVGTNIPVGMFDVTTSTLERGSQVQNSYTSANDKYGIYANASGGGAGDNIGIWGESFGSSTGISYGVAGQALSSGPENRARDGSASGGTLNWAGYFDLGNVNINNTTYIGGNLLVGTVPSIQAKAQINGTGYSWAFKILGGGSNTQVLGVETGTGNTVIGNTTSSPGAQLEIVNSTAAVNGTTDGILNVGQYNTSHLTMDGNEIQARSSSGTSTLYLNYWGADVDIARSSGSEVGIGVLPSSSYKLYVSTSTNARAATFLNSYSSTGFIYGVRGEGNNPNASGEGIGVYGRGQGGASGTAYGLYGYATGAGTNWALYASGNSYTTAGAWTPSDENLKTNIKQFEGAIDKLTQLSVKTYQFDIAKYPTMNFSKKKQYGIMAQNLEQVFPEMVLESDHHIPNEEGDLTDETLTIKAVNYDQLIPVLIKAVQEQQEVIEELKQEIQDLKNQ